VAALALYRIMYLLMPVGVAGAGLLAFGIWHRRSAMHQRGALITSLFGRSVPRYLRCC